MPLSSHDTQSLASALREARAATTSLAAQLKRIASAAQNSPLRNISAAAGGARDPALSTPGSSTGGSPAGGTAAVGGISALLSSGLAAAMKSALSGDFSRSLQGLVSNLIKGLTGSLSKSLGGGIGGSLFGGLIGTGLSLLAGRLFARHEKVQVDNVVRAEVLNFPRLSSLDFASNPASRLFGGRAVARGPAFSVEISYRDGAQDIISTKVAQKISELNGLGL